ncbi:MAG: GNAT family N-acetyltransferase, partial [Pseudonocardia sp.]|nr:GNAT family N-acetyltransferase [Pseudonocardia sp.]
MTNPDPCELTGARTRLREFRLDDVDDALGVLGDERVTRTLSFDSRTREQARAMIVGVIERAAARPRVEYYLAVTPPVGDRLVGFARLGLTGVRAAKLGVAIAAVHWGHGYGRDAAIVLLDFAFGPLELRRVSAAVGPDNAVSLRTVRRLGFGYEGRLRDHVFTNGAWRDSLLFSMLADEWRTMGVTGSRDASVHEMSDDADAGVSDPVELGRIRDEIDKIDREVVRLLAQRGQWVT